MRTTRFELLRPHEILEEKRNKSIVYLPLGPLEWHGPAMPFGTDALIAEALAHQAAVRIGGVVLPTLFIGTERERSAALLDAKGFTDTSQYIVGMDVPKNSIKSLYSKEDVFGIVVREYLNQLALQRYDFIVVVNAHMATGQLRTLERLAVEFSNETNGHVIICSPTSLLDEHDGDLGHATRRETSLMMHLYPESVDVNQFPPKTQKLNNTDWGIADSCTFALKPNEDKTIIYDPRDATQEIGGLYFTKAVESLISQIDEQINATK